MLHATFKVMADLGEGANPVEGAAHIAEVVKCAPVKAAAWPFGARERAAGVNWENIAILDAAEEEAGEVDESAGNSATSPAAKPLGLRATLLHQPLWDVANPVAQRNWDKVFIPGLQRLLPQLQRDISNARSMQPWLAFARLDVVCDRFTIGVPCTPDGKLGDVAEALEQARELLASGTFGTDPARIDLLPNGAWQA